jgi:hypothetical protein
MSLRRLIHQLFSIGSGRHPDSKEKRYDDVQIVNPTDGTVIKGHDAVKAHFEREKQMYETHGSSIILQVYRMNLRANTVKELQGEKLAEIKVDGGFVSVSDTVAAVKTKVRPLLEKEARLSRERGAQPDFHIEQADHITLFFDGRPMRDDTLFYADNFIMLPAWVQVFLHGCEYGKVAELAAKLRNHGRG